MPGVQRRAPAKWQRAYIERHSPFYRATGREGQRRGLPCVRQARLERNALAARIAAKLFQPSIWRCDFASTCCPITLCAHASWLKVLMRVCVGSPCHAYSPPEFRTNGFCWVLLGLRSPQHRCARVSRPRTPRTAGPTLRLCVLRSPSWLALRGIFRHAKRTRGE
jgi:hypothetical protein